MGRAWDREHVQKDFEWAGELTGGMQMMIQDKINSESPTTPSTKNNFHLQNLHCYLVSDPHLAFDPDATLTKI